MTATQQTLEFDLGRAGPALPRRSGSAPFSVSLSIFDWHRLLRDMEEHMRIVNRDWRTTVKLYEMIASQLHGHAVRITVDDPAPPQTKPASDPKPRVAWWRRMPM